MLAILVFLRGLQYSMSWFLFYFVSFTIFHFRKFYQEGGRGKGAVGSNKKFAIENLCFYSW
jgi:hypothetical protein